MRSRWFFVGLLLSVVFFLGACAPSTTSVTPAPPGWTEFALDRYPLVPVRRAMSDTELTKLGLVRGKLEQDTFLFNHYRRFCPKGQVCGKWELLKAGTETARDKDGRSWYKIDCANRLYEPIGVVGWWPFGPGGLRLPWWLPWILPLPLLGLLGWLLGRQGGGQEPPPPPPGNGSGGGPRGEPHLGVDPPRPAPAPPPADPAAARRAALEREIATAKSTAEAHEAEAARLLAGLNPQGGPDEGMALLGRIAAEEKSAKAARADAAAKQAELAALGAPAPPPAPAPAPAPPADDKAGLLASLRAAEQKAGIRHRALRVAIDALEGGTMAPEEVRGWLGKLGITIP